MLYVFGGLPGTGKSVLSRALAQRRGAVHLRIDSIEQTLRDAGAEFRGPEGYLVAYRLAADNLRLGLEVVADSVNPLRQTRDAWRAVAAETDSPLVEIEVVCTDLAEHRRRVETRTTNVPRLRLPSWEQVMAREYEPWDRPHLVLDTAGLTVAKSLASLERMLREAAPAAR